MIGVISLSVNNCKFVFTIIDYTPALFNTIYYLPRESK